MLHISFRIAETRLKTDLAGRPGNMHVLRSMAAQDVCETQNIIEVEQIAQDAVCGIEHTNDY